MNSRIQKIDPGMLIVLTVFTCGLYLIYWYYVTYENFVALSGQTPTGNAFVMDLILVVITCALYGIWVDYKISKNLYEMQIRWAYPVPSDTSTIAIVLDALAYLTGLTNVITSAIHQDLISKLADHIAQRQAAAQPTSI